MTEQLEILRLKLSGCHYQPDGCDTAFVTGLFWDKKHKRPAYKVVFQNGKEDWLPLCELDTKGALGSVEILNDKEALND